MPLRTTYMELGVTLEVIVRRLEEVGCQCPSMCDGAVGRDAIDIRTNTRLIRCKDGVGANFNLCPLCSALARAKLDLMGMNADTNLKIVDAIQWPSSRESNALLIAGVKTRLDLIKLRRDDLLKLRGVGVKTVDRIEHTLARHGLALANSEIYSEV